MQYRRLGKSGLKVSLLSYGSWLTFGKQIGDDQSEALMKYAYDNGINFFDNAEIYSRGESERVMGRILNKMQWSRDSYTVSSKVFFGDGGKLPTQVGLHRKHIVEACNAALKRLQVEYLDLYFCHRPDKETPIEETVWTMHNLIQQGKILYWGTSEWSAQEIMEAHMVAQKYNLIGPVMEQPQYNMFHREKVEVEYSQIYKTVGLGTTIWSPLASGLLTGKYNDGMPKYTRLNIEGMDWLRERTITEERVNKVKQIAQIAKELDMTTAQLALTWCAVNPNVSTIILGASKIEQLKENLESLEHLHKITPEVMERLEGILQNKPARPEF
ncbi:MAG: NADP-dependent aryl-alcohol dehydrogenase [Bacteroidia bacterium]|nr:MAG: NADP-dependent aryl-alcohol dehydrogenase [Bacteroidia bacterium]